MSSKPVFGHLGALSLIFSAIGSAAASDPVDLRSEIFGVHAGMDWQEVQTVLAEQGFLSSGVPRDEIRTSDGTKTADVYHFVDQAGVSSVIAEVGLGDRPEAYRVTWYEVIPSNNTGTAEQRERGAAERFGQDHTCINPAVGEVYNLDASGELSHFDFCGNELAMFRPLGKELTARALDGEAWNTTVSLGASQTSDGNVALITSILDISSAARSYAIATHMTVSPPTQAGTASNKAGSVDHGRHVSGRGTSNILDDLLTDTHGFPVGPELIEKIQGHQEAIDFVKANAMAFQRDGTEEVSVIPTYRGGSFRLRTDPAFDNTVRRIVDDLYGAQAEVPNTDRSLEFGFGAFGPQTGDIQSWFEIYFTSAMDGSTGGWKAPISSVLATYLLSDPELRPSEREAHEWLHDRLPGGCMLQLDGRDAYIAYQSKNGRFDHSVASQRNECSEWASLPRDSGYTYMVSIYVENGNAAGISVLFRDERRTYEHLTAVYEDLGKAEPRALEYPLIAQSETGRLPALLGVELGMAVGDVVALMKSQGYKFIKPGYRASYQSEPHVEDVTSNLVLEPYVAALADRISNQGPTFRLYGLSGYKESVTGAKHYLSLQFISEDGSPTLTNNPIVAVAAIEETKRRNARIVSRPGDHFSEFFGEIDCESDTVQSYVGRTFNGVMLYDEDFDRMPIDKNEESCRSGDAKAAYRATVSFKFEGEDKATTTQVMLKDQERVRQQILK